MRPRWMTTIVMALVFCGQAVLAGAKKNAEGHPGVYDDVPGLPASSESVFDPYKGYQSLSVDETEDSGQQDPPISWLTLMNTGACSSSWNCYYIALSRVDRIYPATGTIRDSCKEYDYDSHRVTCASKWIRNHAKNLYLTHQSAVHMVISMCSNFPYDSQKSSCLLRTRNLIAANDEDIQGIFGACSSNYSCLSNGLAEISDY